MMSVFDGGEGCESAGRSLRSSERFGERRRDGSDELLDDLDLGGVDMSVAMIVLGVDCSEVERVMEICK